MSSIYEKNYLTFDQIDIATKNSSLKLFQPLRTKAFSHKCLPYLGSFTWNGLPDDAILSNNANMFNHKVKNIHIKIYMYTTDKLPPSSPH